MDITTKIEKFSDRFLVFPIHDAVLPEQDVVRQHNVINQDDTFDDSKKRMRRAQLKKAKRTFDARQNLVGKVSEVHNKAKALDIGTEPEQGTYIHVA